MLYLGTSVREIYFTYVTKWKRCDLLKYLSRRDMLFLGTSVEEKYFMKLS